MITIHNDMFSPEEIKELLDFYHDDKTLVDPRFWIPGHRQKCPTWDDANWPRDSVKRVVDAVLPEGYKTDLILFYEVGAGGLRVHTDGFITPESKTYRNIAIPLYSEGPASTVFFNNWWYGPKALFVNCDTVPENPYNMWSNEFQKMTNFTDKPFDSKMHERYLSHIPIEHLYGLEFDQEVTWHVGDCFVADSQQVHGGGQPIGNEYKIGLTIFTHIDD
jgi:hypothetical protein